MNFEPRKLPIYFLLCMITQENIIGTYADPNTVRTKLIAWFKYNSLKPNAVVIDIKADAKAIADSHNAANVIASILPYRNQMQCQQINTEVIAIAADKPLVPDHYIPCSDPNGIFNDLVFSLTMDENTVLSMYLGQMLDNHDTILTTIILTLVKDMNAFRDVYDKTHEDPKLIRRTKSFPDPIGDVMETWIAQGRDPDGPVDITAASADAIKLIQEQPRWDDGRPILEAILMKRSLTYATAVLKSYEEKTKGKIRDHIKATVKDTDLARLYSYIAAYILDKYVYMAELLKNHSDGSDHWVTWTIVIGISHDNDLPLIKHAFTESYKQTLADVVLQSNSDHAFVEVLAVLVSPCHRSSFTLNSSTPPP